MSSTLWVCFFSAEKKLLFSFTDWPILGREKENSSSRQFSIHQQESSTFKANPENQPLASSPDIALRRKSFLI